MLRQSINTYFILKIIALEPLRSRDLKEKIVSISEGKLKLNKSSVSDYIKVCKDRGQLKVLKSISSRGGVVKIYCITYLGTTYLKEVDKILETFLEINNDN